jgi:hypothetical protein
MTNNKIIEIVINELISPTLGATVQLLAIHDFKQIDNKPIIERIDLEHNDSIAIVYIPVIDERFYFAVYVDLKQGIVTNVGTESDNKVYFRCTSKDLTCGQLCSMTHLQPTEGWSFGDLRKSGKSKYDFSAIHFLPNPEPDEFEDKLIKLLDFLEKDTDGVKRLVDTTSGSIQVAMTFHNGNGMFGGPLIDKKSLKRLADLGLEINFDLYAFGNEYQD